MSRDLTSPSWAAQKAAVIAEALPFIRGFHGKTFVIEAEAAIVADLSAKRAFAHDIALLRLVGMNPVAVVGDEAAAREVVDLINQHDIKAIGLTGRDAHCIRLANCEPTAGGVGEIAQIDPAVIHLLSSQGYIPVLSPVSIDRDGKPAMVAIEALAAKLAEIVKAEKLIVMTDAPGILDSVGKTLHCLRLREIEAFYADGAIAASMQAKLPSLLDAIRGGVKSVHVIDGCVGNALLLEVLTNEGVGTTLLAEAGTDFLEQSRRYMADPAA
ncbi:MAG: acetylglutamate kinase [Rhodocyclaceae bacterium]|nr:acetylglutamate kinase [Rhodocyclaceae bacterium]